ncbi:hypothetical protein D9Q81_09070 [Candidatus Korarchaeum cryptofilum]|jgi:hypothetical protein|uniref:Sensory transduction regulator n=2 Tax=Candidatus Korarchaeum cryptofilum TaxID=498846 RepID=B1L399_KORCO|nr:hypothetical protein [Candidatus Korarchaeum cryptofilum]ACB06928.1 hypothetical protein Kcr_0168 [Candidatus Korarchaeum cryptofilum OPF8]RSN67160.1 hypothetical protein D9Q81_09070 [Candidatus Korarchaeum cryptofilum]
MGLDEVEEILEEEGIDYRRVERAVITSFREGEVSYMLVILSDEEMTFIVGKTEPPLLADEELAKELLEENFKMNFASYQLGEDGEVLVTSFVRNKCIKQSFRRNFYATLSFLRKLGERIAS